MKRNWRDQAACRDEEPELFFPVGRDGPALKMRAQALDTCAGCPVMLKCRDDALGSAETAGIFGGLDFDPSRAHLPLSATALTREKKKAALSID